jgi:hypothetical protein
MIFIAFFQAIFEKSDRSYAFTSVNLLIHTMLYTCMNYISIQNRSINNNRYVSNRFVLEGTHLYVLYSSFMD